MAQAKPAPATPGVFELNDEYLSAFNSSPSRGKTAAPSLYLDAIREAIKTGVAKGIGIEGKTDDDKEKHARKISNELRKGAKQLSAELDDGKVVRVKSAIRMQHPKLPPFVGFTATIEAKTQ